MWPIRRAKGNKLHAKKVVLDGITFDSKRESERYLFLARMQREGKISNLRMQVKYELIPPTYIERVKTFKTKPAVVEKIMDVKHKGVSYTADFVYDMENEFGTHTIVEDVKSAKIVRKDVFNLKRQLMWGLKGIDVKAVYKEDLYKL